MLCGSDGNNNMLRDVTGVKMRRDSRFNLLDPFLRLSLLCQCPAPQKRTDRHLVRKSLLHVKADGGCGTFLGRTHLTAELMEQGSPAQDKTQAKGVCTLLRQRQRFVASHQPLVRRAQVPQRPGSVDVAKHPRVLPMLEHRGAVLRGIIERHP